jgi:cell division protein FtsX
LLKLGYFITFITIIIISYNRYAKQFENKIELNKTQQFFSLVEHNLKHVTDKISTWKGVDTANIVRKENVFHNS